MWSLGVALYKMCVGLYPFERLEDAADARTAVQVCAVLHFLHGCCGSGWCQAPVLALFPAIIRPCL